MKKKTHKVGRVLVIILGGVLFLFAVFVVDFTKYIDRTYELDFGAILYTLLSTLKGAGGNVFKKGLMDCLPALLMCLVCYTMAAFLLCQRKVLLYLSVRRRDRPRLRINLFRFLRRLVPIAGIVTLIVSLCFCSKTLGFHDWAVKQKKQTKIYEEHYINPSTVSIRAEGKAKNLIYIYLESMEITYASKDVGGIQETNYIPNLTSLALSEENISFSDCDALGGFSAPTGSTWTMGALFSTTTGLPFAFPVEGNSMDKQQIFASGVTTLGDILEGGGYVQEFLCGSNADFAGRRNYFTQHGNYEIFDYNTAVERGYIEKDHYVWWGYEDYILFEIAKDEALRLAATGQPFNLTFLTVDQHAEGGYVCPKCGNDYDVPLANILACGDRLVMDFVNWCREQDFYEDTVIIISGDHPRMDKILINDTKYADRQIYNCFINAAKAPIQSVKNRIFTSQDMFPTILSAMGFEIEGNRLGLGTDMFSAQPTLAEELGLKYFKDELKKSSAFYLKNFS